MAPTATEAPARDAEDLASHPGRPRAADEIDPELIVLPRRRTRISPVLAGALVVFCVYMMIRLRGDLAFSLQDDEPDTVALGALANQSDGSFVEVAAIPDRANLYRVTRSSAEDGHRAAPVLGENGAVWLLLPGSAWVKPGYSERYRGRLYTLGDMPFHDELAAAVDDAPAVPQPVAIAALKEAIESGAATLTSVSGERIDVGDDTVVDVRETVADRALVTTAISDDYPNENTWRAALSAAGLIDPSDRPVTSSEYTWTYEVRADDGVEGVAAELVEARLFGARAEPLARTYESTWGELESRGDELVVGDEALSWGEVSEVGVAARPPVLADARVVVTTERPDEYWYLLPVYGLFVLFAGLFGWAMWRGLRVESGEAPAT